MLSNDSMLEGSGGGQIDSVLAFYPEYPRLNSLRSLQFCGWKSTQKSLVLAHF